MPMSDRDGEHVAGSLAVVGGEQRRVQLQVAGALHVRVHGAGDGRPAAQRGAAARQPRAQVEVLSGPLPVGTGAGGERVPLLTAGRRVRCCRARCQSGLEPAGNGYPS